MNGSLYLIPSPLGPASNEKLFPSENLKLVQTLRYFIVENIRTARRFLRSFGYNRPFNEVVFFELNKRTDEKELVGFLTPLQEGHSVGIISEAGVPSVADPGALIVKMAHEKDIRVIPLIGPSSILLALMASGMSGQNFCFTGYLPIKQPARNRSIRELENRAFQNGQTQIFMETPYRNMQLLKELLKNLKKKTLLCIASNISLESEFIRTKTVKQWETVIPDLHKKPTIFLISAG